MRLSLKKKRVGGVGGRKEGEKKNLFSKTNMLKNFKCLGITEIHVLAKIGANCHGMGDEGFNMMKGNREFTKKEVFELGVKT